VLAGAGSLGNWLLGYERFRRHGMLNVATFDTDPEKIGQRLLFAPKTTETAAFGYLLEVVQEGFDQIPLGQMSVSMTMNG
jgi:hypothetical protein